MTATALTAPRSNGLFSRVLAGLAAAVERRRAYRTLMEMDDRMLADIGVNRGAIAERLAGAQAVDAKAKTIASVSAIVGPISGSPAAANEDKALHHAA